MAKERILVTVKTYPTMSRKYGETVCTAGVREDGSWVRIYPVPFRRLEERQQYRKFDWLECDLVSSQTDAPGDTPAGGYEAISGGPACGHGRQLARAPRIVVEKGDRAYAVASAD